jgi:hypothetical protein
MPFGIMLRHSNDCVSDSLFELFRSLWRLENGIEYMQMEKTHDLGFLTSQLYGNIETPLGVTK